ncbi:MAG: FHA domain-containing protein [Deltaproteobacteria bacterium]|nr:FHA domain-containing protein [Deltaproteobacteria bacterium]
MYKLIIEDDEGKTTVVPLIRDEISIGRKEGNTIRLTERNVSRRHAKLLKQSTTVFIEDLASYNGIKVNGNRINGRIAIGEGDRIQIGDYVLGLKVEGQAGKAVEAVEDADIADSERATAQLDVSELIGEDEPAVAASTEPPRLVCVSSNFAGMEWVINKSVMVIGRIDDNNDVVVNHRSISRHHARVVEEHGRYTIVDMQSANGVWVNGEDYGKVELRKGDLIDLGHVRLRFVAPGEDFVFERDAVIVDPAQLGGRSRGTMWVVLALLALGAVGVFLWKLMDTSGDSGQVTPPTKPVVVKHTPDVKNQSALLSEIDAAMERRDWQRAIKHCTELNAETRKSAGANCDRAALEQPAQKVFENAVAAATKNEHQQALELFFRIPKTSSYYSEREKSATYLETRKKFRAQAGGEIDDLLLKKDCEGIKKLIASAARLLGETSSEFDKKLTDCQAPAIALVPPEKKPRVVKPRVVKRPVIRRRPPKRPPHKPTAPTEEQKAAAKQHREQAWTAYRAGQDARTVMLGKKYLRVFPKDQQILSIVGASACKMKDARTARSVSVRLQPSRRNMLKSFCIRRGVPLP